MSKKDILRKLTSRKLWLSVASFVSMLCIALGGAESEATQISALIMAGATVIGYAIGEGLADSSNSGSLLEGLSVNTNEAIGVIIVALGSVLSVGVIIVKPILQVVKIMTELKKYLRPWSLKRL